MLEALLLFVVLYSPGPAWDHEKPLLEQGLRPHGAFVQSLLDDGVIVAAGPLIEREGGLVLMRADSREAAAAIVARDPAVHAGIFVADIQSWPIRFATPGFAGEVRQEAPPPPGSRPEEGRRF